MKRHPVDWEKVFAEQPDGFWLGEVYVHHKDWIDAIEAADQGKGKPIAKLVESKPIPPEVRGFVADLIQRLVKRGREGRPGTPAYLPTIIDIHLYLAVWMVRHCVTHGWTVPAAIEVVAKEKWLKVDRRQLDNAYRGKLGSFNRLMKKFTALKYPGH